MDKANYKNNGLSSYPLSTEALDFIQNQIELVHRLATLAGDYAIIRQPTASAAYKDGLVVLNGELLPLTGAPSNYILVAETKESVSVGQRTYKDIRTRREARYVGSYSSGAVHVSAFKSIVKNGDILSETRSDRLNAEVPLGGIILWSGSPSAVPANYALCNGQTVNGRQTPDLRGRFVVGYDPNDAPYNAIGKTGGEAFHTLSVNEMPSHRHYRNQRTWNEKGYGASWETPAYVIDKRKYVFETIYTEPTGGDAPHENRPPYYVIAYIMRVK